MTRLPGGGYQPDYGAGDSLPPGNVRVRTWAPPPPPEGRQAMPGEVNRIEITVDEMRAKQLEQLGRLRFEISQLSDRLSAIAGTIILASIIIAGAICSAGVK